MITLLITQTFSKRPWALPLPWRVITFVSGPLHLLLSTELVPLHPLLYHFLFSSWYFLPVLCLLVYSLLIPLVYKLKETKNHFCIVQNMVNKGIKTSIFQLLEQENWGVHFQDLISSHSVVSLLNPRTEICCISCCSCVWL